jgi:hypothetical protein
MHVLPASLTRLRVSTAKTFDSIQSAREYARATTPAWRRCSNTETTKTVERDWIPRALSLPCVRQRLFNIPPFRHTECEAIVVLARPDCRAGRELEKLENEHMAEDAADMHHGSLRHDGLRERTLLLETLIKKSGSTVSCLFAVFNVVG